MIHTMRFYDGQCVPIDIGTDKFFIGVVRDTISGLTIVRENNLSPMDYGKAMEFCGEANRDEMRRRVERAAADRARAHFRRRQKRLRTTELAAALVKLSTGSEK